MKSSFTRFLTSYLLALTSVSLLHAQSPNWQWAKGSINDGSIEEGWCVATDRSGNVYISGTYTGAMTFDSASLPQSNGVNTYSAFLAKCDASGKVLWTLASVGNPNYYAQSSSVATDALNNVYITGSFSGNHISIGSITLNNSTSAGGFFIAKCDSNGQVLWMKGAISSLSGYASGISVTADDRGGVYAAGSFFDTVSFGSISLTSAANSSFFLVKYDSIGYVLWARTAGQGSGVTNVNSVATDSSGVYITGSFQDSILFDTVKVCANQSNNLGNNFMLAKFDYSGNILWAKTNGGDGYAYGYSVATDKSGQVYVTGYFTGDSVAFGNSTLFSPTYADIFFVARYNSAGNFIWAKQAIDIMNASYGYSVVADTSGHIYVAGGTFDDSFVFEGSTFNFQQTGDQAFLFTLDSDGNLLCGAALKGGGDDQNGVACDQYGNAYIGGDYWVDSLIFGSDTLYDANQAELIFLAKFNCNICTTDIPEVTSSKTIICPGDTAQLCAPSGFSNYRWNTGDTTTCINATLQGSYDVTVSNNGQCTASSGAFHLSVYTPLPVTVSVNSDTLTGYSSTTYQWLLNGVPITGANSSVYVAQTSGSYSLQVIDTNGCTATSTPVTITGITNEPSEASISIFPNPTNTSWQLTVGNEWIGSIAEIFDATGRLVFKSQLTTAHSLLTIPNASSGVYQLRIAGQEYSAVRKLVKM